MRNSRCSASFARGLSFRMRPLNAAGSLNKIVDAQVSLTACKVIAQSQNDQDAEPEESGAGKQPDEGRTPPHVHKEKNDQRSFRDGDKNRENYVQRPEIDVSHTDCE